MVYIGLDGDSIGRVIESLLIQNKIKELKLFSTSVVSSLEKIQLLAQKKGAEILFCTGDSILLYGDLDDFFANHILEIFRKETNRTASIGIGSNTAFTYLGLKLAKSRGGNQVVNYENEVLRNEK